MRLVADYGDVRKKAGNHSRTIPNIENTLEQIEKCGLKMKTAKRSGFWQIDLARTAQELLAFVTPKGRVFRWKVMPFHAASAPALFLKVRVKDPYIMRHRPIVQEPVSRRVKMEAHIDDVRLDTNIKEDHILFLQDIFTVYRENHHRM